MPNDDFLKQFQQAPSDEFSESLLASLRQLDAEEREESPVISKTPIIVLPPRRRSHDRYLSWIASLALLFLFSSVLLFSLKTEEVTDSANSLSITRLNGLSQLAWSPDGRLLYLSDESRIYRLNLRLQLVDSWPVALEGSVTTMQFVGNYLLLGDSSGAISLWNSETMQMLETMPVHNGALELMRYLPTHQVILTSGADGNLVSLSLRGSQLNEISRLPIGSAMAIRGLAVHPNEQQIIATSSNAVSLIYEMRENGSLAGGSDYALNGFPPTAQADYLMNGQFMMLAWWDTLRIVDSQTLAERYHYSLPEPFLWLSPLQSLNNRVLLANPNGLLGLWDFTAERYLEIYRGTNSHPLQAAFHPEGQLIAAISQRDEVRLWRIESLSDGGIRSSEVAVNRPTSNQPVEDAPLVLAPLDDDFSQVEELYHFGDGFLLETLWSPDGSILMLSSTSTIRLYDAELRFLREWSVLGMDLTLSAFSPDGRYLITGTQIGTVAIWDVMTGRIVSSLQVHEQPIAFLAFLNGGSRILSRDESGEFALLDFNASQLSVQSRSEQAALASWDIQDWQANGDNLRLLMGRHSPDDFSTTQLINVIEMSLGETISAEAASTGLNGNLGRFVSDGRILIYEQRDHRLHLYGLDGMRWMDTFQLPINIATLNYLAYDAAHEQLLLVDFDRSLSLFSLTMGVVRPIDNASALLERPAHTLSLHPAGEKAAVITSHNRIALWQFSEAETGAVVEEIANDSPVLGQIRSFITASSNLMAASTSEGSVLLFDSITGNLLRRLDLQTWGIVNHDLRFNADSSILAVLGQDRTGVDSLLHLIDVQAAINGESEFQLGDSPFIFENEYVAGMAFNSYGDILFTGGSRLRRWTMSSDFNEAARISTADLRGLTIFAHHPRIGQLATLRPSNYLLLLETSNMEDRYLMRLYGRSMPANTFLEYSEDGNLIVIAGDGTAPRIFDSQSGELMASLEQIGVSRFSDMVISREYLYFATEQGILAISIEAALENPANVQLQTLPYVASQIAISADNRRLFYLGRDGMVTVLGLPEN